MGNWPHLLAPSLKGPLHVLPHAAIVLRRTEAVGQHAYLQTFTLLSGQQPASSKTGQAAPPRSAAMGSHTAQLPGSGGRCSAHTWRRRAAHLPVVCEVEEQPQPTPPRLRHHPVQRPKRALLIHPRPGLRLGRCGIGARDAGALNLRQPPRARPTMPDHIHTVYTCPWQGAGS